LSSSSSNAQKSLRQTDMRLSFLLIPFTASLLLAQAPLSFEVASIKPAEPGARGSMLMMKTGGGFQGKNITIKLLIQQAYSVRDFQVSGGPGWMSTEHFDIIAKCAEGTFSDEQTREMMQSLLADRFQLIPKRETKDLPAYSLVVAKGGPKLKEAVEKPSGDGPAEISGIIPKPTGASIGFSGKPKGFVMMGRGQIKADAAAMESFANSLSNALARPVIDHTGLTGRYDIKLDFSPEGQAMPPKDGEEAPADSASPSIFTAVQEQLGLKLEATHAPGVVIVVERLEKPSAN
jgi:uncharacterized protein (TIGR03435 family)